jgi:hypothetical protein
MIGEAFRLPVFFLFLPVLRFPEKNCAPGWRESADLQLDRPIASPCFGPRVSRATRIHSEASMRAPMRSGGISTFFDPLGFMLR